MVSIYRQVVANTVPMNYTNTYEIYTDTNSAVHTTKKKKKMTGESTK